MSEVVEANFALTERDFFRVNGIMLRSARWVRPFYLFMGLSLLLCLASNLIATRGPRYGRLAIEIAGLAFLASLPLIAPWIQTRQTLKGSTQAFAPQSWLFGHDGVRFKTPASEGSFQWSVIIRVTEHPEYLLLYISEATAYPVPKRALPGLASDRLRLALKGWLGSKAELLQARAR